MPRPTNEDRVESDAACALLRTCSFHQSLSKARYSIRYVLGSKNQVESGMEGSGLVCNVPRWSFCGSDNNGRDPTVPVRARAIITAIIELKCYCGTPANRINHLNWKNIICPIHSKIKPENDKLSRDGELGWWRLPPLGAQCLIRRQLKYQKQQRKR
jgi:hypothetical protein